MATHSSQSVFCVSLFSWSMVKVTVRECVADAGGFSLVVVACACAMSRCARLALASSTPAA